MSSIQIGDFVDVKQSPARQLAVVFVKDCWVLLANGEILNVCDVEKIEGQSWVKTSIVWSVVMYLNMTQSLGLREDLCPGDMVIIFDDILEMAVIEMVVEVDIENCHYVLESGAIISMTHDLAMPAGWTSSLPSID